MFFQEGAAVNTWQQVHYILSVLGHIFMFIIELGNMRMIAFEFHHTTQINNKWKPKYYSLLYLIYNTLIQQKYYVLCSFKVYVARKLMKLNTNISDGNRIFFQVYPLSAFLNTSILYMLWFKYPLHLTLCGRITGYSVLAF
jgi:hypothetical protein